MLLKVSNSTDLKLPKLKTEKNKSSETKAKKIIDDSEQVARLMKELFSKYNWKTVTTEKELLDYINSAKEFGLDCETTSLDVFKGKLVGIFTWNRGELYLYTTHT